MWCQIELSSSEQKEEKSFKKKNQNRLKKLFIAEEQERGGTVETIYPKYHDLTGNTC